MEEFKLNITTKIALTNLLFAAISVIALRFSEECNEPKIGNIAVTLIVANLFCFIICSLIYIWSN